MFNGVSTSGSSLLQVQLGTSGGFETSGYLGTASGGQAGLASNGYSSGFLLLSSPYSTSSAVSNGSIIFTNFNSNVWVAQGVLGQSNVVAASYTAGSKSLASALTQVRFTTDGTDTFDAGSINILYE